MFKFVFCALFVVAAAKPDILLTPQLAPLATTYIAPTTTTITKEASGFISQGPLLYSSPLGYAHYIKKRSAPLTYIAPTTYFAKPALATYTAPLATYTAPILPAALPLASTHFIKKRSAPVLATSYIAPTYTAPLVTPALTTTPLVSSPLIAPTSYISQPLAYTTHLIKKRSVPVAYTAPTAITYQSKFDLHGAPIISAYGAPYTYSASIPAYTHVF